MNQRPIIDPAFDGAAERLPTISWLSSAGLPLPPSLSEWCKQVTSVGEAVALLDGGAWEEWSGDRDNTLGAALSQRHPKRYQEWNLIVRRAKEVLSPHDKAIRSGLDRAGFSRPRAIDVVKWDIVGARTCAAYQDCRIPSDELRLLDIYQAGHVPMGFDTERQRVLVFWTKRQPHPSLCCCATSSRGCPGCLVPARPSRLPGRCPTGLPPEEPKRPPWHRRRPGRTGRWRSATS